MRLSGALLVCAGCGSGPHLPATPQLALADHGVEPREVIHYLPPAQTSERAEITIKIRTRVAYENTVLEHGETLADLPAVRVQGPATVTSASPTGEAAFAFQIETAESLDDVIDPQMRTAMASRIAALRGTTMTWRRDADGTVRELATTARGDVPRVGGALENTQLVFPVEPIGVGATWRVTSTFIDHDIRWLRTQTFHLVDRSATAVTIDMDEDFSTGDQALSTEPNATTHLRSGHGHGTTHSVVPLDGILSTVEGHQSLELNLPVTRGRMRVLSSLTTETIVSVAPVTSP